MLEVARILAVVAAVLLIVAGAAWARMFRRPALLRVRGTAASEGRVKSASHLLGLALGASAVAAILATLDLMAR